MKRFNKKEYTDARKRIRRFIKEHHRLPQYCKFKNQQGKIDRLTRKEYCGLFQGYMQFYLKHGREPNYLTLNTEANYPLVINYQDDPYSCCPTSLQMCLQFLFDYKYESYIKKVLGTNKDGTTPTQLIQGAKKLGYKNSTSNATSYGRSGSMTANTYTSSSTNASTSSTMIRFKGNAKTLSYYVGNRTSSTYGLARSTTFAYIVIYSE